MPNSQIKVGIVFALNSEARALECVLAQSRYPVQRDKRTKSWFVGESELMVVVGGVGRKRCAHATLHLVGSGAKSIVCAGFAAALDPVMSVGDVYVANRLLLGGDANAEPICCHQRLAASVPPSGSFGFVIRHGDLVTGESVVSTAVEKSAIFRSTGAGALDMESYAAAEVCRRAGVPFTAIRSISDSAGQDLPRAVEALACSESALRQLAIVLTRPGIWPSLARLRRQSRTAAENLGETLALMLLRLL